MKEKIYDFFNRINLIIGVITTELTNLFGIQWILFAGYLVLNIIDFITGCIKARVTKTESSVIGFKGILKKICYWILILVAFLTSYMISNIGVLINIDINFILLFGWFTLACLIINEIRSILENLVKIGIEVPEFLVKGLKIVSNSLNNKTNIVVKDKEKQDE